MKKYETKILIGAGISLVLIITVPIFLAWIIPKESFISNFTSDNDWIGFYGSYSGSVIGGLITLMVMMVTIKSGKKDLNRNIDENKRIQDINDANQFCDKMIDLVGDYCSDTSVYFQEYEYNSTFIEKEKHLEYRLSIGNITASEFHIQMSILDNRKYKPNRKKSVSIYFKLKMLLKDIEEANELIDCLSRVHKFSVENKNDIFDNEVDELEKKTVEFVGKYKEKIEKKYKT